MSKEFWSKLTPLGSLPKQDEGDIMQTVAVDQTAFIAGYKYTTERIRAIAGGSGHPNTTLRSLSVNQPELAKSSAVSGGGLKETGANSSSSFGDKANVARLTIQVRIFLPSRQQS